MPKKKVPTKKAAKKTYRSGFEKKIQKHLKEVGVPFKYEEGSLEYTVPQSKHRYIPDFTLPNGILIEAKGNFDRASRKKMELVIQQHPDKDIRMLFMRNNTISKKSKTKYSDWCDKRGITYAVSSTGEVPEEWLHQS